MKRYARAFGVPALLVALVFSQALSLSAQTTDRVDKVSNGDFARTVKQLETAIKQRGLMIVATIDHQNMLRMVGGNIRGAKTLEFGKPDMMKSILADNPEVGVEMPLKIYVYERADGKTVVSYRKPSAAFASYGNEQLTMAGQMMDMMLDQIATDAAK